MIKNIFYKSLYIILFTFFGSSTVFASHIVGGEIYYKCLGNNQYEVTMEIYRDCFFGNPNAYFDDPAVLGLFDTDNELVQHINIKPMGDDTLPPRVSNECLFVPGDICVHTTRYRDTITIPDIQGGFTLSYQRCCRNETISNIIDPDDTGATFSVVITEKSIQECNSSPVFNDYPPVYICINEPIDWDHGATDPDGDSIVYSLCTPFTGLTRTIPERTPNQFIISALAEEFTPPYDTIVWQEGFGLDNILGSENKLRIDSQTGFITGVPQQYGQYVVGICMSEYRNGELLSVVRRDFQYNVGDCEKVTASISNDTVQCENNTVEFINTSIRANDYTWKFYDINGNLESTSNVENPVIDYVDTGKYKVTLIAEPFTACVDSVNFTMFLKEKTIDADFNAFTLACSDEARVSVENITTDPVSPIASYEWSLNADAPFSSEVSPEFIVPNDGNEANLKLVAISTDGCTDTLIKALDITHFDENSIQDTFALCSENSIVLSPTQLPADRYDFSWSPMNGLSATDIPNPTATPTENTSYSLTVTDTTNNCMNTFNVYVAVPNASFESNINLSYEECQGEDLAIKLIDNSVGGSLTLNGNRTWTLADGSRSTEREISMNVKAGEPIFAILSVQSAEGCTAIDTLNTQANSLELNVENFYETCQGDQVEVRFKGTSVTDGFNIVNRNWVFSNGETSTTQEPIILLPVGESITAELTALTAEGCIAKSETPFGIRSLNAVPLSGEMIACNGVGVNLNPNANPNLQYTWSPSVGLDDPNAANPEATVEEDMLYTVTIADPELTGCTITDEVSLLRESGSVTPMFDFDLNDCEKDITISFEDMSVPEGVNIEGWNWVFSNGTTSAEQNPSLTLSESQELDVELRVLTDEGCFHSFSENDINIRSTNISDLSISSSLTDIVQGDSVFLFAATSQPNVTYTWVPENLLENNTVSNPLFVAELGDHDFVVNITDENGCTEKASLRLEVDPNNSCVEPNIFVPTGFTPNGDDDNPELFVYGQDITEMEFVIYSRWGQEVFKTTDQNVGWDGTFGGEELSPDVYGYHLRAVCSSGNVYIKKGNVSILR